MKNLESKEKLTKKLAVVSCKSRAVSLISLINNNNKKDKQKENLQSS